MLQINAPLHEQIRWDLMERIRRGEFPPDSAIPNETQLCEEYSVSRITVRRAVGDLCADEVLYRRRGVGTFVKCAVSAAQSIQLRGNLAEVLAEDSRVRFRLVGQVRDVVEDDATAAFPDEVALVRLDFEVTVDGTTFALAQIHFPKEAMRGAKASTFNGTRQPILRIAELLRRPLARAEQKLFAAEAEPLAAEKLGIPVGSPIMQIRRTYYDAQEEPIALVFGHLHPRHIEINVKLQFSSSDSARVAPQAPSKGQKRTRAPA